jgi:phosphate transport system substrate-binding protein
MKVSLAKGGTAFESLCNPDSKGSPDIAEVSRRVTPAELRTCAVGIMELKIGHQALLLARGRLYGPLKLSARDLFLALARRIPNPAGPQELIDNPNTTWNQVDGALPYDRIHILAPVLDPADGKLTAALLLEAGCNTYPWIADLRTSDATRYEEICRSLRSDGAYEESADTGWAFSESLVRDPTALGIFTVRGFEGYKDKLIANAIDGIEPTLESVAAETYPASRSLYLYVNKRHASGNFVFDRLIGAFLSPFNSYGVANGWALVSLDAAERTEVQASLKRF